MNGSIIDKPLFPGVSAEKVSVRLLLRGIGGACTERSRRLRHPIATVSPDEEKGADFDQPLWPENESWTETKNQRYGDLIERKHTSAVTSSELVVTDVSAAELVAQVTRQQEAGRMSAGEASDLLYPFLFDGPLYERRQVFATLQKVATPEAILVTALRVYRLQGYEGYLNEAASLLAGFGAAAWPAIRQWAEIGGAECESLVETAFSVEGLSDAERLDGLKELVRRGDHNTRSRALSALHLLPPTLQRELLAVMARTGEPDDPTRDEAAERLAEEWE
jgi:hypothetical protein